MKARVAGDSHMPRDERPEDRLQIKKFTTAHNRLKTNLSSCYRFIRSNLNDGSVDLRAVTRYAGSVRYCYVSTGLRRVALCSDPLRGPESVTTKIVNEGKPTLRYIYERLKVTEDLTAAFDPKAVADSRWVGRL